MPYLQTLTMVMRCKVVLLEEETKIHELSFLLGAAVSGY